MWGDKVPLYIKSKLGFITTFIIRTFVVLAIISIGKNNIVQTKVIA